jgi:hypothetical protein
VTEKVASVMNGWSNGHPTELVSLWPHPEHSKV